VFSQKDPNFLRRGKKKSKAILWALCREEGLENERGRDISEGKKKTDTPIEGWPLIGKKNENESHTPESKEKKGSPGKQNWKEERKRLEGKIFLMTLKRTAFGRTSERET